MSRKDEFRTLCARGEVSGPVSESDIQRAEIALGVEFPKEYLEFLAEFGCALIGGVEIYGLPDPAKNNPPLWQDVVAVTKQLRDWGQAGTEKPSHIPIAEDGTGVYFFLDTSEAPATKIYAIGPGVEKIVSSSFYDFFVDLSEGNIEVS